MTSQRLTSLPQSDFNQHRSAFFNKMPNNTVALFPGASDITRSNDTDYNFCQNKNFYYLTGFNEADALLVLIKESEDNKKTILFSLPKDELQEVWHGRRIGQEQAVKEYGVDQAFVNDEINHLLPEYLTNKAQVFFAFENQDFSAQVFTWISQVKGRVKTGDKPPAHLVDSAAIIDELRLIKSANEIAVIRQANVISGKAHQRAMQKSQIGMFEYQIEAEILHEFSRHGARNPAYATIVAGGDNANILHYTNNDDVLKEQELLLIDAGGELGGYAADITRTFPVCGKFTPEQKAIYQLVLDAKNLAISAIKPGVSFAQLNEITNEFLTKGLLELGILTGELTQLISDKTVKSYFIHGLGHWLGLDVHDVGSYQVNEKKEQHRPFAPGMVLTIEPGIYIARSDTRVAEKWRGIGARIEDNIAVTEQGFENLTKNAPETIADIEALMSRSKPANK